MSNKLKVITELYEETVGIITNNINEWESFLKCVSMNYKYSFIEQVLIYAQKKDAIACADIETWNKSIRRWVNKGAKGIALLSENKGYVHLRYVFDVTDTNNRFGQKFVLWKVNKDYENIIIESLENKYGKLEDKTDFVKAIYSFSNNIVQDNIQDYFDTSENKTKDILVNSIAYVILIRCGYNSKDYINNTDSITKFNEINISTVLGTAISDIAEMGLRDIYTTIKKIKKNEKNNIRTFESNTKKDYDSNISYERGDFYGDNLQNTRGLSNSKLNNETQEQRDEDKWQVRNVETKLYKNEQESILFNTISEKPIDGTFNGYTGTSRSEVELNNVGNDKNREYNRRTETTRSIEMDRVDEQSQELSRRDNKPRTDIQLNMFENEEDNNLSHFFIQENQNKDDDLIGKKVTINDRVFIVDSINNNRASLQDITFQSKAGFPIFRDVSIDYIKKILAEKEEVVPEFIKPKKDKINNFDLYPKIPLNQRNNYKITDNNLGVGSLREKFNRNYEAIKVLKKCEVENRYANTEEQELLSKYIGFGGLSQVFDERNSGFADEYIKLKNILTEDEYNNARESTLTAFYTPPIVIKAMYKAIEKMGLKDGNILEPSCGIGNFIGMLPSSLEKCKIYGVELDSISGRIARQLYQKSSIAIAGYENTNLPDSFFDVAIGNVPFGDFKVLDKRYDKNKFLIHDYFFAKTLDKVRPGGIIAFITSKGTLDKENPSVRKYISSRADLLGSIRLPNNTFKDNAGTETTSDIIFLQKRDSITDIEPDWVNLDVDENNISINKYFAQNPNMIMGKMEMVSSQHGMTAICRAFDNSNLEEQLDNAITNIHAQIKEYVIEDIGEEEDKSIPADYNVKNFSYTIIEDKIYYRENNRMYEQVLPVTTLNRIKSLIEIRDCTKELINMQIEDYSEQDIKASQDKLNKLYDRFIIKYGLINSRANNTAFSNDNSYYLLCSLEILDENNELLRKADMFHKRTIKSKKEITTVDTANEGLILSISEKARVDIEYICKLTNKTEDEVITDLEGAIFKVPNINKEEIKYVTADEYLSGNVREKLKTAKIFAEENKEYLINAKYLEGIQPVDLEPSEISVRLGATWLPSKDIEKFIYYLLTPSNHVKENIKVNYMESTAQWNIVGKNYDRLNVKANSTYGTNRMNAYKIIEETLNLKDARVYDYYEDENGKKKQELNKKETAIAAAKQEQIKLAFEDWVWKDVDRRNRLTKLYNEKFNSIRPREYNGSYLNFSGINPEIKLREHQLNAIARIIYGGNTLLAHEVGAGKTFEMVASAMELKRLGLCNKSLFVVPNHIVEQFSSEFLQLFPSSNILVTTKKDFETANRKKFCSRIATGDYDAIIISHSQFEKIPMSVERQRIILGQQIDEITSGIRELKNNRGESFTIKQLEKTKKTLQLRLEKLNDQSRKDDVVTFEELGVDRLFVDEAHYYKNLFLYTKMRNVGGIAQTEAQKSSDLFMKCRYLDEITNGKGVIFATGTPISNSMVELYTMQRYLQYQTLKDKDLQNFDSWASTFGETTTAIELAPEGTGYRAKTRFAKFYNLPELMSMFKEIADIKTSDMLNLPIPKANYQNIVVKPIEIQKEMVKELSERAEKIRGKLVDASVDNMLKITNDGRKLALDQRLINPLLEDDNNSKLSICSENIYKIWDETKEESLTQLVFCDLSTPTNDGSFNVYDDLKDKLINKGIPSEEIAFIHDASSDIKKKEMFSKVRKGSIRVLIGSTQKMGAGTNVQDKLVALHDLDCPWRPSDLVQRSGRIVRQGNKNKEVFIYRYVTESTFDSYLYQIVENKQRFVSQIMTSKSPVRYAEDVDETALSYAEIKALAAGNPLILEKTELDAKVSKLRLLKQNHLSEVYSYEDKIVKYYPSEIKRYERRIVDLKEDVTHLKENSNNLLDNFQTMVIKGKLYTDKEEAGTVILELCKSVSLTESVNIGTYRGFEMNLKFDTFYKKFMLDLKHNLTYTTELGGDIFGNITRIDNTLNSIESSINYNIDKLEETKVQFENAKEEVKRPFPQEQELTEKTVRLNELNILLNLNEKDKELIDNGNDEIDSQACKKEPIR